MHRETAPEDVWGSFYGEPLSPSYSGETNPPVSSDKNNKIFVYNCVFSRQLAGSIKIERDSVYFLHSYCIFTHISNPQSGGSIYVSGSNEVIQHRYCAFNVTSESVGLFSFTYLDFSPSNNMHTECSITHCRAPLLDTNTITAVKGRGSFINSNTSQNSCINGAGFSFADNDLVANYVTVANNVAQNNIIFITGGNSNNIKNSNIAYNELTSGGTSMNAIVFPTGTMFIESCCFYGNNVGEGKLFCRPLDHSFIASNCYFDMFSNFGNDIETPSLHNGTSSLYLAHISTQKCNAIMPFDGCAIQNECTVAFDGFFRAILFFAPSIFVGKFSS